MKSGPVNINMLIAKLNTPVLTSAERHPDTKDAASKRVPSNESGLIIARMIRRQGLDSVAAVREFAHKVSDSGLYLHSTGSGCTPSGDVITVLPRTDFRNWRRVLRAGCLRQIGRFIILLRGSPPMY
jgi:hypothetical protein